MVIQNNKRTDLDTLDEIHYDDITHIYEYLHLDTNHD